MTKKALIPLIGIAIASFGIYAYASTFVRSASTCSPDSPTRFWVECEKAFSSNDMRAKGAASVPSIGFWNDYGYDFLSATTSSSTILSVSVGVEGRMGVTAGRGTSTSTCETSSSTIAVRVSQDGGSSFGPSHGVTLVCTEATTWVDVTGDWPTWTTDDLKDANFVVEAECTSGACELDWLPVEVTTFP